MTNLTSQAIHELSRKERHKLLELPSGGRIDLFDFDEYELTNREDCFAAMNAFEEHAIHIEFHISLFTAGLHHDGAKITHEDPIDPSWHARAKKALAWARLRKSICQQRFQSLTGEEKDAKALRWERLFIDYAKADLKPAEFESIKQKVDQLCGALKKAA